MELQSKGRKVRAEGTGTHDVADNWLKQRTVEVKKL